MTDELVPNPDLKMFFSAVDQNGDSVVITDRDGVIQYVNPAFEQLTGFSKAEAIGRTPALLKSGFYDKAFYSRMWQTILSGETFRFQFINKKKNGKLYDSQETITPIRNEAGEITHFVSTGKDMTERVRVEQNLVLAESKYKSIFDNALHGIFQTDLDGRYIMANSMEAQILGYDSPEDLMKSVTNVKQVFVNPEERERLEMLLGKTDEILAFEFEAYRKYGKKIWISQDIRVVRDETGDLLYFEGLSQDITHRKRSQEALQAQKTDAVGQLAAGVAHDFNNTLMAISGYAEWLLYKIGDDEPLRKIVGEIQKGVIQGSELTNQLLEFSRHQELLPSPELDLPATKRLTEMQASQILGNGETILLVDDFELMRNALGSILELKGYQVLQAEGGARAMEIARNYDSRIDLLITDMVMPEISGKELAHRLRSQRPDMKILYLSGYTEEAIGRHGELEPGGAGFLSKPANTHTVLTKVRELLNSQAH